MLLQHFSCCWKLFILRNAHVSRYYTSNPHLTSTCSVTIWSYDNAEWGILTMGPDSCGHCSVLAVMWSWFGARRPVHNYNIAASRDHVITIATFTASFQAAKLMGRRSQNIWLESCYCVGSTLWWQLRLPELLL